MKIILATDGTKYGAAAVDMLCKFNLVDGDQVKIISVVDMAVPLAVDMYGGYLPDTTALETAAREQATKVLVETKSTLQGFFEGKSVDISSEVLFGSPDSRIVETAEETGADLIVIGSHGYKRWERLLLGSVSNSVVHHAHCSVMVVRAAAE